jgi:hypothetical protein
MAGVIGERRERPAQSFVACPSEQDGAVVAGGVSDGRQTGLGRELLVAREARTIVPELGEDLSGIDGAAARQALHERTIGMLRQRCRDGRGELLDVSDERGEDGDERADDFTAGLRFGVSDVAGWGRAETGQQLGGGAPATVGVLAEELSEALFAEAGGALGVGYRERKARAIGESTSAKMAPAPGQKPSRSARS